MANLFKMHFYLSSVIYEVNILSSFSLEVFRVKRKWRRQDVGFLMLTKRSQCKNLKIQVTV